jgi:hypothetical protein
LWQSIGIKNSDREVEALCGGLMIPSSSWYLSSYVGFVLVGAIEKRNPKTKRTDRQFSGTLSVCRLQAGSQNFVKTPVFWLPETNWLKLAVTQIEYPSGPFVPVTRKAFLILSRHFLDLQ